MCLFSEMSAQLSFGICEPNRSFKKWCRLFSNAFSKDGFQLKSCKPNTKCTIWFLMLEFGCVLIGRRWSSFRFIFQFTLYMFTILRFTAVVFMPQSELRLCYAVDIGMMSIFTCYKLSESKWDKDREREKEWTPSAITANGVVRNERTCISICVFQKCSLPVHKSYLAKATATRAAQNNKWSGKSRINTEQVCFHCLCEQK